MHYVAMAAHIVLGLFTLCLYAVDDCLELVIDGCEGVLTDLEFYIERELNRRGRP